MELVLSEVASYVAGWSGIQGDGQVRAIFQDFFHQIGEHIPGADFYKIESAVGINFFDLLPKAYRFQEVFPKQFACRLRVVGVGFGRGVGIGWNVRAMEGDGFQGV